MMIQANIQMQKMGPEYASVGERSLPASDLERYTLNRLLT